jgi:acetyl-CoA carboxylase biotin carboxyl carrier protein
VTDEAAAPDPYADACRAAAQMVAALPGPLSRLRISHRDVLVEIEWQDGPRTAELTAAAPAAPGGEVIAAGAGSAAVAQPSADARSAYISAATVGTFYRSPGPGEPAFVSEGDRLQPGMQVAILESMKMMVPVEADCTGEVVSILVPNGGAVEYGEPLIQVALAP